MINDFSIEYRQRTDEELLQLASDRVSLTDEAAVTLDAELRRRNLTQADVADHERFVKRNERRESKRRLRKLFGTGRYRDSWVDRLVGLLWSAVVISVITLTYQLLPNRYHFTSDWEEAALVVMFSSVFIAIASKFWWHKMFLWFSLLISS